ncbi:MAG: hypothetical protein KBG29_13490 [Pseudomonadales bacterium]|nr:hypothetical protein [Pseudomonadales bacterium]
MGRARLPRIALVVLMALAVSACGTRVLYDRLDTLLYFHLASQVTLDDEQAAALRASLRDLHDWHRGAALPAYAGFLETLADDMAQPAGAAGIEAARIGLESLWRDTVAGAAPAAARWLAGLGPAQRDEFFAGLAERDVELRREYCDIGEEERRRNRERSVLSALGDWLGRLDREQRTQVRGRLQAIDANGCDWIASRASFRARLRQLVDTHATDPRYEARLARLLTHPQEHWDPAYRARYEANGDVVVAMLAELDRTLSERQRARLGAKLRRHARDLRELTTL